MQKVWTVAAREFRSTVMTKAFVLGLMLPPVLMGVGIVISLLFSTDRAPAIRGTVAVIDRTSQAAPGIERRMTPEAISKATSAAAGEAIQAAAKAAEKQAANPAAAANPASQIQTIQETLGSVGGKAPELTLELLAPDADVEAEKQKLLSWRVDDLTTSPPGRLTLIVIEHDTIRPPEGSAGTPYALYTAPKVDPRVTSLIRGQVSDAVIEARLSGAGFDPARIEQLTNLPRPKTTEVTAEGTRASTGAFQFIIPLAFFLLIWISAFSGAGQLLNNTIEEKSNRIMEVLLSAVSPFQLMAGKILGQFGAGLIIVSVYAGAGIIALLAFQYFDLIKWWQLAWLCVFYVISYLFIAAVFAAIGSAVTDIQEANSLMTPAMLLIMIPMFTIMPIVQNPTGMLARVLSFVPPFSPFAMIARVGSNQPPPQWEIALSALVGILGAIGAIWCAAKIFRIGVLLYGKPPSLGTLIKWIRMA